MNPLGLIFVLGMLVLWATILFYVGRSKKVPTWVFYTLLYLPVTIGTSAILIILTTLTLSNILAVITMLYIVERVIWGITLHEASGKDNLAWFYWIFFLPVIGWLIYWTVDLGK